MTAAAAADGEPSWSQLPPELLQQIAERTRDVAGAGVTPFRSVCRAWRAAASAAAPRLLLPLPENSANPRAGSEYALVFPLARGWSAVVDVRDTSCRLTHLATGATAALPHLNAVRATPASRVVRLGYEYLAAGDDRDKPAPATAAASPVLLLPQSQRNFRVTRRSHAPAPVTAKAAGDRRRRRRWKVRMDSRWKRSIVKADDWRPPSPVKIKVKFLYYYFFLETHLQFSDMIRFAAAAAGDMPLVIMYHPLQGQTGLVFCRPGDVAWTKVPNPVVEFEDEDGGGGGGGRSSPLCFVDFAFLDGDGRAGSRLLALDNNGVMAVFDAATLEVLHLVDAPPETRNFSTKIFPYRRPDNDDGQQVVISCLHLVALPMSRLLMVRIQVRSSEPESFDVFELVAGSDEDGIAWRHVTTIAGGYDLFLDGHHATFAGGSRGSRIYYVHDKHGVISTSSAAYCYDMVEDRLECVYRPPKESDCEYSTRPSWFVP
ncbi:unnamed protein product [Urochloa decumbens]|uniref:KIB1-4 beta-propeller domain-containing protein n=1 Tax=Urochloa decumbens TaxID=240449 RepID=A0ABC9FRD9_9POAL